MKTLKSKKITAPMPAAVTTTAAKAPATPAPARATTVATPTAKAPAATAPAPRREITSEIIAARAYTIWEQKGRPQGCDLENWLLAESQLKREIQSFTA